MKSLHNAQYAGLQIKTSSQEAGQYLMYSWKNLWPDYPIVYFDLGNDFQAVRDKIFSKYKYLVNKISPDYWSEIEITIPNIVVHQLLSRNNTLEVIEYHFCRGKEISPEIHEKLLYYRNLLYRMFKRVFKKEVNLDKLDNKILEELQSAFALSYAIQTNPKSQIMLI